MILYVKKDVKLEYGKIVSFLGEYSKPSRATNYKAFDYRNYLKTQNVYGTVTASSEISVSKNTYLNPILVISNNLKNMIEDNLEKLLGGEEAEFAKRYSHSEILHGLSEDIIEDFRISSIYHVLAVSGTHVRNCLNRINYLT